MTMSLEEGKKDPDKAYNMDLYRKSFAVAACIAGIADSNKGPWMLEGKAYESSWLCDYGV
jgi:hypothetical protein